MTFALAALLELELKLEPPGGPALYLRFALTMLRRFAGKSSKKTDLRFQGPTGESNPRPPCSVPSGRADKRRGVTN